MPLSFLSDQHRLYVLCNEYIHETFTGSALIFICIDNKCKAIRTLLIIKSFFKKVCNIIKNVLNNKTNHLLFYIN